MYPDNFQWVTCPNCGHKFHKLYTGDYDIEKRCHSCKGTYRIRNMDGILSFEQIESPRRTGPSKYKS